ncbi:MAG: hypothetical protein ACOCVC_02765 [Spirochaeta sp.]
MIKKIISLCCIIFASGCSTTPEDPRDFSAAPLHGMIYNSNGHGIFAAQLVLHDSTGDFREIYSDIQGRFSFPHVPRGRLQLSITHPEYEEHSHTFDFLDRTQILYLKLISWMDLIGVWKAAVTEERSQQADILLGRIRQAGCPPEVYTAAQAVHAYRRGETESAYELLDSLSDEYSAAIGTGESR